MLSDESKIGCHIALTPTWNETTIFADFVLPMGHAGERHDLQSQETHAGTWIAFRQPVLRAARERAGRAHAAHATRRTPARCGKRTNSGSSCRGRSIPTARSASASSSSRPTGPARRSRVDEYYRCIFENSVPGLPEAAAKEGLDPLEYMRRYGAFEVKRDTYELHEGILAPDEVADADVDPVSGVIQAKGAPLGVMIDGVPGAASRRRRAGWSSSAPRWRSGDGRSTRSPATCRATSTRAQWTRSAASSCWCRPSACPR